jgi:RES domain-containing protein
MASRPTTAGASMELTQRGGEYNRLAEPEWTDPLDTTYSQSRGGRWNPPGSFPVLYLNDSTPTARLQVLHKLAGLPYGPEDLDASEQHDLAVVRVPEREYLDCVSEGGLTGVGLPSTYPRYRNGRPVRHAACHPIGQQTLAGGLPGIACRSAATSATREDEELAFFDRPGQPRPQLVGRVPFDQWWWEGI